MTTVSEIREMMACSHTRGNYERHVVEEYDVLLARIAELEGKKGPVLDIVPSRIAIIPALHLNSASSSS